MLPALFLCVLKNYTDGCNSTSGLPSMLHKESESYMNLLILDELSFRMTLLDQINDRSVIMLTLCTENQQLL